MLFIAACSEINVIYIQVPVVDQPELFQLGVNEAKTNTQHRFVVGESSSRLVVALEVLFLQITLDV